MGVLERAHVKENSQGDGEEAPRERQQEDKRNREKPKGSKAKGADWERVGNAFCGLGSFSTFVCLCLCLSFCLSVSPFLPSPPSLSPFIF